MSVLSELVITLMLFMSVLTDFDKTLMFMHECLYRVYKSRHVTKWTSSIRLFPYELLMSFRNIFQKLINNSSGKHNENPDRDECLYM